MLRLHLDPAAATLAAGAAVELPADAARHVQVRRLQPGDTLVVFDGSGGEWTAQVTAMSRRGVQVRLDGFADVDRELPLHVTLALGMPANERMDWLVEKASELGAACIRPLHCERSVLRLDGERAARKRAHWRSLAVAACEQCGRTRLPRIEPVASLRDGVAAGDARAARWLLSPRAAAGVPALPAGAAAVVVLGGPEGGLTDDEEALAVAHGFVPVGLGPRVLRAETAPLAVLARLALGRIDVPPSARLR